MKPDALETEADYETALARAEQLMDAAPGSPEEEELDDLVSLIETYERVNEGW